VAGLNQWARERLPASPATDDEHAGHTVERMSGTRITRLGLVNAYLVVEDDGLTLIDTTLPGGDKAILRAATDLGKPIVRIVLTHAHMDHVGALDKLAATLPDAEVLISSRDARLLAGDVSLDPDEPQDKIKGGVPKKVATRPTRTVEPGERIGSLEVVDAKGHTPGQIALLDDRDGTLYCADAYSTLGGVATTAKPNPRFPLPAMATWHRPTALETARRLRALDPQALAPGHGRVVDGPGAEMERAIARAA
jgi:glyoxylase-like metal-dependent hydrolase (beta-lactamase superfamily II)